MSRTINQPGQDLPTPVLPGTGDDDAIGRPDVGPGIGEDMPTRPVEPNPAGEPDPTRPGPAVPGMPGGL
ncbi:hypothetical protein [Aureimonas ureilytica]|uniref:hypothetical protein n=1 Tax=Aureimonas ureilytica TaxID=401562 RepID=UPI00036AEBC8|nr:hypothetical protein [Aureimonas ureilytica]